MPFVKLDTGMLQSSLWIDHEARSVFLTMLLLARPHELTEPAQAIGVADLQPTGFVVPAGWYGMVEAAGPAIVRTAGLPDAVGMAALQRLTEPDLTSRTIDYEGRRVVRVAGGYVVLNYMSYRDRDSTAADRARRYRERLRNGVTRDERVAVTPVTQAEAEAEAVEKKPRSRAAQRPEDVTEQVWTDFAALRRQRRAPVTATVLEGIRREAKAAGISLEQALRTCVERGWQSFRADWASVTAGKQSVVKQAAHVPNMPLGHVSCMCPGCVAYRTAKARS